MKAAVIGDVHGHAKVLAELIRRIRLEHGNIPLYQTGDLIDRGPDSKGVLDLCIEHGVTAVRGNHDLWLRQFASMGIFEVYALHPIMGGKLTLESYGVLWTGPQIERTLEEALPQSHREYLLKMPVWLRFEAGGQQYRLTHAGLDIPSAESRLSKIPGPRNTVGFGDALLDSVAKTSADCLMWTGCDLYNSNVYPFPEGSCQIFGHLQVGLQPLLMNNWIAMDTGCGKKPPSALSAVILPDREIVQVISG